MGHWAPYNSIHQHSSQNRVVNTERMENLSDLYIMLTTSSTHYSRQYIDYNVDNCSFITQWSAVSDPQNHLLRCSARPSNFLSLFGDQFFLNFVCHFLVFMLLLFIFSIDVQIDSYISKQKSNEMLNPTNLITVSKIICDWAVLLILIFQYLDHYGKPAK